MLFDFLTSFILNGALVKLLFPVQKQKNLLSARTFGLLQLSTPCAHEHLPVERPFHGK